MQTEELTPYVKILELVKSGKADDMTGTEVASEIGYTGNVNHLRKLIQRAKDEIVTGPKPVNVAIDSITIDEAIQPRVQTDEEAIARYSETPDELPPADVFQVGDKLILADGRQRLHAWEKAGWTEVPVRVRQGTRDDALKFAAGSNSKHGSQRKPQDIRRAVRITLERWPNMSSRAVAEIVRIWNTSPIIEQVRAELKAEKGEDEQGEEDVRVGKDGRATAASSKKRSESRKKSASKKPSDKKPRKREPGEEPDQDQYDGEAQVAENVNGALEATDDIDELVAACPLLAKLAEPQRSVFKGDARIYYRFLQEVVPMIRAIIKQETSKLDDGATVGPFEIDLTRVIKTVDPRNWKELTPGTTDPFKVARGYSVP